MHSVWAPETFEALFIFWNSESTLYWKMKNRTNLTSKEDLVAVDPCPSAHMCIYYFAFPNLKPALSITCATFGKIRDYSQFQLMGLLNRCWIGDRYPQWNISKNINWIYKLLQWAHDIWTLCVCVSVCVCVYVCVWKRWKTCFTY